MSTSTQPVHLIVGPQRHGVTEYARLLAASTGARTLLASTPQELDLSAIPADQPVHVTFTDHLWGATPSDAADCVLSTVAGRPLSISFHDIPQDGEGTDRMRKRTQCYLRLRDAAQLVVCNSRHEAAFFSGAGLPPVDIVYLPLPDHTGAAELVGVEPGTVGMLGFLYPGKGHAEILDYLVGSGLRLRALGEASRDHESLPRDLVERGRERAVPFEYTGFLPEPELHREMSRIAVPVCAHKHASASGSLMRWIAAGRKVLASDISYNRELAQLWPQHVIPVPADQWREALRQAAADPSFSLAVPNARNWGWDEVANQWTTLWLRAFGTGPELVSNVPEHRRAEGSGALGVSVIIPYYNDQEGLDRVLRALHQQDYPGEIQIIIADDGSEIPPQIDNTPGNQLIPVTVVRQEDVGFRAAAARNIGAREATHPILAFLDGDTEPEPGYLTAATSQVASDPRTVVIGTRLHGSDDIHGMPPQEPAWLRTAWVDTDHLRLSDERSFRYVISSVLTLSAEEFHAVGGFDESMVGYGGEDWELGWRLWHNGAILRHEPAAITRHRAPDWGARDEGSRGQRFTVKNAESIALAQRITHPDCRPDHTLFTTPDIAVVITKRCLEHSDPGVVEQLISSWLSHGDIHVYVPDVPQLFSADPRVRSGAPSSDARIVIHLRRPVACTISPVLRDEVCARGGLAQLHLEGEEQPFARMTSRRRRSLDARGISAPAPELLLIDGALITGPLHLERLWANW